MTLNDILVSALAQLDRGHDEKTIDAYRDRLTQFANDAQADLANTLALVRTDKLGAKGGVADLEKLPRSCTRVERVSQRGAEVPYRVGNTPNLLLLPYADDALITYRYEPKRLKHPTDVSELNESLHPLIVSYVVGRERMGGDVSTQDGGNIYLSMYNAAKQRLRGYLRSDDSFRLINRY